MTESVGAPKQESSSQTDSVSGLYRSLVQQKIHQDQLLWSRVGIAHAVEAGVLAGGFALHFGWGLSFLGGWLLVCGGLLMLFLFFLIIGDYADMKVNDGILDKLARRLLPAEVKGQPVRWTDEDSWHRRHLHLHGHHLIYSSIILFVVLDFVSGILLLLRPSIFG